MIHLLYRRIKQRRAIAKLQRIVAERANSFEVRSYRQHRAAAKQGWAKKRGMA
ncbi:hypothetical protein LZK98_11790 [Sphingomonas cannabina]|uniref:hypothetical protein n=1 Tax=Sphingomonas cannabina TaxID=2899123 RepID=UPI001F28D7EE|nr:hypothetical protein [Sphingomonas cannabina]UIJ43773.1 hypothetical protein LZK98_11790 [Sphingomonas cannabina]